MAYNDVPLANQRIKDSQSPIRSNFLNIQIAESVNHVPIEDPSGNQGKHTFIQIPNVQGADVSTALGEVALYTKTGKTNVPALFFRGQSNAAVPEAGFTEASASSNGWTRLPSGILLKWGTATAAGVNPATIPYPVGDTIPAFTAVFNIQVSPSANLALPNPNVFATLSAAALGATDFQVWHSERTNTNAINVSFYYLAIGV